MRETIFAAGGVALFLLAAGGVLAAQWRHHRRKGQVRSWLLLQLLSPPLTVAAYHASLLPAGRVEGMGALGIAMAGLVTIAPIVYFGGHLLIGKVLGGREGLSVGESMAVAVTTLALAGGALALYGSIGQSLRQARSEGRRAGIERAEPAPNVIFQASEGRFFLPDGQVLAYARYHPRRPVHLERVDVVYGGRTIRHALAAAFPIGCICGGEIHLAYLAEDDVGPPVLRYFWRPEGEATTYRSEIEPDLAGVRAEAFALEYRPGAVRLPIPIAARNVSVGAAGTRGTVWREPTPAGTCPAGTCTRESIPLRAGEHAVQIRLYRSPLDLDAQRRYDFSRPAPEGVASVAPPDGMSRGPNTASITRRAKRADTVAGPPPISIPTSTASNTSS